MQKSGEVHLRQVKIEPQPKSGRRLPSSPYPFSPFFFFKKIGVCVGGLAGNVTVLLTFGVRVKYSDSSNDLKSLRREIFLSIKRICINVYYRV